MNKIKLTDYQVRDLKSRLSFTYDQIEQAVKTKYNVAWLEDINHRDYDDVVEFIQESHVEITEDLL